MTIKESEIYRSFGGSCDAPLGVTDTSQCKDCVRSLLLIKYIADRYGDEPNALIAALNETSFEDMVVSVSSLLRKRHVGSTLSGRFADLEWKTHDRFAKARSSGEPLTRYKKKKGSKNDGSAAG